MMKLTTFTCTCIRTYYPEYGAACTSYVEHRNTENPENSVQFSRTELTTYMYMNGRETNKNTCRHTCRKTQSASIQLIMLN